MNLTPVHITISFVVSLLFSLSAQADTCDRMVAYSPPVSVQQVSDDLVSGKWVTDLAGAESTLYFDKDGTLEVLTNALDNEPYRVMTWTVRVKSCTIQLLLKGEDFKEISYDLKPTCDGFALDGNLPMVKHDLEIGSLIEQMRSQVLGAWEHSAPRKKKYDLQWTFAGNGTFTVSVGPDRHYPSYQGVWDISPDARGIVLNFASPQDSGDIYETSLLKVHSLDFEDMVLSGEPVAKLLRLTGEEAKMYFEKSFH